MHVLLAITELFFIVSSK